MKIEELLGTPIVIMVSSGKGGVGKTTTVVNISRELSRRGYKTLIVSMDWGQNNVSLHYNVNPTIGEDIFESDTIPLAHKVKTLCDNLSLLQAPITYRQCDISIDWMDDMLNTALEEGYQYVILDSPTNVEQGFYACARVCDIPIWVTTSDRLSITGTDIASGIFNTINDDVGVEYDGVLYKNSNISHPPYVIVNRVESTNSINNKLHNMVKTLNMNIIGIIPVDDKSIGILNHGDVLNIEKGGTLSAISRIIDRLLGKSLIPTIDDMVNYVYPTNNRVLRFIANILHL